MSLFQTGMFHLHSGQLDTFKVECDALDDMDWNTLAEQAAILLPPFGDVMSVPTGGDKFAEALLNYCSGSSEAMLIADDVLTTGDSIETMRENYIDSFVMSSTRKLVRQTTLGVVAFARGPVPSWVTAVWRLGKPYSPPPPPRPKEVCRGTYPHCCYTHSEMYYNSPG